MATVNKSPTAETRDLDRQLHEKTCRFCGTPFTAGTDRRFLDWQRPEEIAGSGYPNADERAHLQRHALAVGLFDQRKERAHADLDILIDAANKFDSTKLGVEIASRTLAKLAKLAAHVQRIQTLDHHFDRLTEDDLTAYAEKGILPRWMSELTEGSR